MYVDRWLLLQTECYSESRGEIWPLAVDTLFQTCDTFYVVLSGKAFVHCIKKIYQIHH